MRFVQDVAAVTPMSSQTGKKVEVGLWFRVRFLVQLTFTQRLLYMVVGMCLLDLLCATDTLVFPQNVTTINCYTLMLPQ